MRLNQKFILFISFLFCFLVCVFQASYAQADCNKLLEDKYQRVKKFISFGEARYSSQESYQKLYNEILNTEIGKDVYMKVDDFYVNVLLKRDAQNNLVIDIPGILKEGLELRETSGSMGAKLMIIFSSIFNSAKARATELGEDVIILKGTSVVNAELAMFLDDLGFISSKTGLSPGYVNISDELGFQMAPRRKFFSSDSEFEEAKKLYDEFKDITDVPTKGMDLEFKIDLSKF